MITLVLIFLGGGFGSVARFLVSGAAQRLAGGFPVGTLTVNVLGCLLIGLLGYFVVGQPSMKEEHRLVLLIGFLGGFTTFSTFGYETMNLVNDGEYGRAVLNVLLSNILGLFAVWFGFRFSEYVFGGGGGGA